MKLNLVQKQSFYHELGQFLKSGIALPQAVEALGPEVGNGALRKVLNRLQRLFLEGESVSEAFAQLRPTIGEMEVALITASSHSGRLEQALSYLAEYFGTMETLRASIVKQLFWPIVRLHIGVLILPIAEFYFKGDTTGYFIRVATILAVIYFVGTLLWLGCNVLLRVARDQPAADGFLRRVPLIGAVRRNMALNRFCATYEMQLQSAINSMDGLRAAGEASQSAVIQKELRWIIPRVRSGEQVSSLLSVSRAFPPALQRVFRLGEQTGSLDEDLRKWSDYYRKTAIVKMESLGNWLVRAVTVGIVCYLVYSVLKVAKEQYFDKLDAVLKQM